MRNEYVPEDGVYRIADKMPLYGDKESDLNFYVRGYLEDFEADTNGIVFVSFVVDSLGHVGDYQIKKSLGTEMDSLAIQIIQDAPKTWTPGSNNGDPVAVRMVYPVKF